MSDPRQSEEQQAEPVEPFNQYYHKNIAAFTRLLEVSPPGTFTASEIKANHYAAGGVVFNNQEEIEYLLDLIEQGRPPEGEHDEYERADGDAGGAPDEWALAS